MSVLLFSIAKCINFPNKINCFFSENTTYTLEGKVIEEQGHTIQDETFNMKVKSFSNNAKFIQRVNVTKGTQKIHASVEFMVCRDTRCLPPKEVDLRFDLTKAKKDSSFNIINIS